jgi:hypothetical protein
MKLSRTSSNPAILIGSKGERRPADVIGNAITAADAARRIAERRRLDGSPFEPGHLLAFPEAERDAAPEHRISFARQNERRPERARAFSRHESG